MTQFGVIFIEPKKVNQAKSMILDFLQFPVMITLSVLHIYSEFLQIPSLFRMVFRGLRGSPLKDTLRLWYTNALLAIPFRISPHTDTLTGDH